MRLDLFHLACRIGMLRNRFSVLSCSILQNMEVGGTALRALRQTTSQDREEKTIMASSCTMKQMIRIRRDKREAGGGIYRRDGYGGSASADSPFCQRPAHLIVNFATHCAFTHPHCYRYRAFFLHVSLHLDSAIASSSIRQPSVYRSISARLFAG